MEKGKASTTLLSSLHAGITTKQVTTETRGMLAGQAELLLSPIQQRRRFGTSHYLVPEPSLLLGSWDARTIGQGVIPPVSNF